MFIVAKIDYRFLKKALFNDDFSKELYLLMNLEKLFIS